MMIAMVILSTLSTMIMIMIMMSICEYHDNYDNYHDNDDYYDVHLWASWWPAGCPSQRSQRPDSRRRCPARFQIAPIVTGNWKITSCQLAGKLENYFLPIGWKIGKLLPAHWLENTFSHTKKPFSVSHLGSWAGSLLHTKPCSVNSTLKRSLESKQLRAQQILDRVNLDCHLFFLSRLKPGNGLLFFCIFLSLLGLHLLHHLLKLLLWSVIRTQQLSLLLKLENLEAFFFEDDFKFRDPLLRKLVDDPLCRSFAWIRFLSSFPCWDVSLLQQQVVLQGTVLVFEPWEEDDGLEKYIWDTSWLSPVTRSPSLAKLLHRSRHRHPVLVSIPENICHYDSFHTNVNYTVSYIYLFDFFWVIHIVCKETHFKTAEARVRCSLRDQVSIGVCFSFSLCWTPDIAASSELNPQSIIVPSSEKHRIWLPVSKMRVAILMMCRLFPLAVVFDLETIGPRVDCKEGGKPDTAPTDNGWAEKCTNTTWWGFREAALGLPFAFSSSSLPLAGHLENREENLFREARYLDFLSPGWTAGRQKKIRRANLFFQLLQNYNLQESRPTKQNLQESWPTKQDLCWINVQLQSFD